MNEHHQSITIMPNGEIYSGGAHDEYGYPLQSKKIGAYKKQNGLIAKTNVSDSLSGLISKVKSGGLTAADSIANAANLAHLQLIRLKPEAQGTPVEDFFLEGMFPTVDVPMLRGRETYYDVVATAQYKERLEETKATTTKYDGIEYHLKKLSDKVFTPIEDMIMTIINPQTVDMSQIKWGFKYKRNQSALEALKTIGNNEDLESFGKVTAGSFHSDNRAASNLNKIFNKFRKENKVGITDVAMNSALLDDYSENTWTLKGPTDLNPIRLAGGGVVPLPGIAGVTAHIDNEVPDNKIYAVNKQNALRLGEGPKIMRRYFDEEREAEAIKMTDFHQHLAVNTQLKKLKRKFGMTITVGV